MFVRHLDFETPQQKANKIKNIELEKKDSNRKMMPADLSSFIWFNNWPDVAPVFLMWGWALCHVHEPERRGGRMRWQMQSLPFHFKMFSFSLPVYLGELSCDSGTWIIWYVWVHFDYQSLLRTRGNSIVEPNQFPFFKGHPGNSSIHF